MGEEWRVVDEEEGECVKEYGLRRCCGIWRNVNQCWEKIRVCWVRTDHFTALDEVYCLIMQHGGTILGKELGRKSIRQEGEQCPS